METYEIAGRAYPILGYVTTWQTGTVPLVDLPMMSDERWNELARENAVHNFTQAFGHSPNTVEEAVEWQRERAEQIVRKCEAAAV